MSGLLERMGWNSQTTTHGIRAAFKTWATERTNYPREVVELCLSHVQRDELDRAYQRGDILDNGPRLMQERAYFSDSGEATKLVANCRPPSCGSPPVARACTAQKSPRRCPAPTVSRCCLRACPGPGRWP